MDLQQKAKGLTCPTSASYAHSLSPQTKIHLFVKQPLMMYYMLINYKFTEQWFSVFPELFYSYRLNSPSNGTIKPKESLVSTTKNRLHYILNVVVNELGHKSNFKRVKKT